MEAEISSPAESYSPKKVGRYKKERLLTIINENKNKNLLLLKNLFIIVVTILAKIKLDGSWNIIYIRKTNIL